MSKKIVMIVLMCICLLMTDTALINAKISMNVGQTKKLKAFDNNNVKWKIKSGKSVSINKRGIVTALRKGRAIIIATKSNKKKTIIVKVKNVYYKCDMGSAAYIIVTNLDYGTQKKIVGSQITDIADLLTSQSLYRTISDPYKKMSGGGYSLKLYNADNKEIMCLYIKGKMLYVYNENNDRSSGPDLMYTTDDAQINCDIIKQLFN